MSQPGTLALQGAVTNLWAATLVYKALTCCLSCPSEADLQRQATQSLLDSSCLLQAPEASHAL